MSSAYAYTTEIMTEEEQKAQIESNFGSKRGNTFLIVSTKMLLDFASVKCYMTQFLFH